MYRTVKHMHLLSVQVVVEGHIKYSDPANQKLIEELISNLENSSFIDSTYTENWMRDFLAYTSALESNITTETMFVETLKVRNMTNILHA